jgi:hypothetical protein
MASSPEKIAKERSADERRDDAGRQLYWGNDGTGDEIGSHEKKPAEQR